MQAGLPGIRSHFDAATGTAFYDLLIPANHVTHALAVQLSGPTRDAEQGTLVARLGIGLLSTRFEPTLLHEWHHFLQMLAYPFQYLQACRELKLLLGLVEMANQDPGLSFDLHSLEIHPAGREMLRAPARSARIIHAGDLYTVEEEETAPGERDDRDISETLLAEEATSVFVYRTTGGAEDGRAYRDWLDQHHSYEATFSFLERLWGPDEAFLALTPLVQASFFTTEPCAGFLALVNHCCKHRLRPSELGVTEFYRQLFGLLTRLPPVYLDADAPRESWAQGRIFMIRAADFAGLVEREVLHPARPVALAYIERLKSDQARWLELLTPLPTETLSELRGGFQPAYTSIQLRPEGHHGYASVALPNKLLLEPVPEGHPYRQTPLHGKIPTYAQAGLEIQRLKDVGLGMVTRAASRIDHRCPHAECPMYQTGASRRWFPVPPSWPECPFPAWYAHHTRHVIDPLTSRVVPLGGTGRRPGGARGGPLDSWPDGWRRYLGWSTRQWLEAGSPVVMPEFDLMTGRLREEPS